jgi:hypothetical protein
MVPRLINVKYRSGYKVWLRFDDGKEGEVDLQTNSGGEAFR